ncbi:Xaa-Pro peptidase family protein [Peptococcaceae bacterium 1198_IL3148]
MNDKLIRLRAAFTQHNIDALIVSRPENRRYLSGFTGTTANLMIDNQNAYIYTDFRYIEQAKEQCPDFKVIQIGNDYYQKLLQSLQQAGATRVGFETDFVTYESYAKLAAKLAGINLIAVKSITEDLRMIKDQSELQLIERAVEIADQGWAQLTQQVKPGMTEEQVSLELEFAMRRLGAENRAFDFIVASGPRGALPHGVATDKTLQPGEMVTIDFGAVYQGYYSDITRNFVLGQPNQKQLDIYNIVLEAQLTALDAVKPGVPASVVDLAARNVIEHYGYGEYFGHGTGHGIGLAIHEGPRVSFQSEEILQPGMMITIEPGIYLPGWGGVRIEDSVLVTENGYRILTQTPKDHLLII